MLASVLFAVLAQGNLKGMFEIPDWVAPFMHKMKQDGFLMGYPDGLGRPHKVTRFELAVTTHATSNHLTKIVAASEIKDMDVRERRELIGMGGWAPSLIKLVDEFGPELAAMGIDKSDLKKEVTSMEAKLRQMSLFKDVPDDHWAAAAVRELGKNGLLRGFPDNKYRGQSADAKRRTINNRPSWVGPVLEKLKGAGLMVSFDGMLCGPPPSIRYEDAVATHTSWMQLKHFVEAGDKTSSDQKIAELGRWAPACLLNLVDEYRIELKSMGVEVPALVQEISNLKQRMKNTEGSISRPSKTP
ncbi:MAG: S-layer homology domain-containing protein [Fimbriimonadaceae bacterium]